MLADLPRACDVGSKRNAKGHTTSWIVYGRVMQAALIGSVRGAVVYSACWCDLPMEIRGTGPHRVRELESIQELTSHLTVCPYLSSDLLA